MVAEQAHRATVRLIDGELVQVATRVDAPVETIRPISSSRHTTSEDANVSISDTAATILPSGSRQEAAD